MPAVVDAGDLGRPESVGLVARASLRLTAWTERWIPDAFIFALLFTGIVFVAASLLTPSTPLQVIDAWGSRFWDLIPLTLQMAMIVITGHVLATSPVVGRLIAALALWPQTPRAAVAFVSALAMLTSLLHWGFSLIFCAMLAREIARAMKQVDYRALAAGSYLGQGTIWAQGLSGSAVLQMATAGGLQPAVREIVAANGLVPNGVIPLSHTIFLWQNGVAIVAETIVVVTVMWLATPPAARSRTAADLGVDLDADQPRAIEEAPRTPGTWLEHSPVLSWFVCGLGLIYVVRYFSSAADALGAINLNILNFIFLVAGVLLHRTPLRFMRAVQAATPAVWGILLQFPFYAGIAGIIVGTHLNERLVDLFLRVSTPTTFAPVVATYSAVLGVFVPSGGSKWVIEAPYLLQAAHSLRVNLGWVVNAYGLGEALANLIQPFFMLPILTLLRLQARDLMGYTLVVGVVLVPLVMVLVYTLGRTLPYPM